MVRCNNDGQMLKRVLLPFFNRLARSLGVLDLQERVARLEKHHLDRRVSDDLYMAIEDRFRGAPDEIRRRQLTYLESVRSAVPQLPVLDLGCGRGEWLEILREAGIPAIGVDGNHGFVASCRERGLDARLGDIVDFLRETPSQSLGAVTMFQVAEHLPLVVLESVLAECHRVLAPNGVLLVEIPNIETLRVGAATFWIDPTHERPVFPEFLVLLVERAGFGGIERRSGTPLEPTPSSSDPLALSIHRRINGDGDFAVLARRL